MAEREEDIIARAQSRFKECQEWEQSTRQRFKDDIRFLFADPDNQEQWDAAVRASRQIEGKPLITINKTHTHWLHVVNEAKRNKPAVHFHPTGDAGTYEAAQIFEALVRHTEYISDAQTAYDKGSEMQVGGGIGYWRLKTGYVDEGSFDQEIFIKQLPDPLCVFLDPYIKNADGSDARYGFIFEEMPRKDFEDKYPNIQASSVRADGVQGWILKNTVRVAEYFEVETKKEWLYAIPNEEGGLQFMRESQMDANVRKFWAEAYKNNMEGLDRRRVDKRTVRSYIIAGNSIAEKGIWPGRYIPIIRVPGEEVVIDGRLDRKGLVRYLKDAQRAYNYNTSASLEFGALQSKMPYKAPVEAVEGLENYWATANTNSYAYLPYNHRDEQGNPIPAPEREQPPTAAPAFLAGMQSAEREMMMASGQYEATFSEQGNEISGVGIDKRQRQGERVTFHFLDNYAKAIRFTGKQLLDLYPKIYDTKRVIRIMAEDGEQQTIQIDPQAKQAVRTVQEDPQANKVRMIFNPNVGEFDVTAAVGPSYDSRRQEAFEAMTNLLAANPALAQVIGDLYMGTADFPVADKLQERMRNWIPKNILGEGPTPEEQQLMQQVQFLSQQLQTMGQQLQEKDTALALEKQRIDMDAVNHLAIRMENERKDLIEAFKATTARFEKLLPFIPGIDTAALGLKTAHEALNAGDPNQDNVSNIDPSEAYAYGMPAFAGPPTDVNSQAVPVESALPDTNQGIGMQPQLQQPQQGATP